MQRPHIVLVALVSAVTLVPAATPAAAATRGPATAGTAALVARDVSFPQCGSALPRTKGAVSGVLGANNGTSFSRNPCLVSELRWAKRLEAPPAFYANTGNPGSVRSTHWPVGQTTPKSCTASDANSLGCSYDYGWNAGRQSFATATDAAQKLHHVARADARQRVANVDWWLDVETMNTWQASEETASRAAYQRDVETLAGEIAALRDLGVVEVGHLLHAVPVEGHHRRFGDHTRAVRRHAAMAGRVRLAAPARPPDAGIEGSPAVRYG